MQSLPPELASLVFVHFVALEPPRIGSSSRLRTGPLVLASVCSSWRALALRLPELWGVIRIYPPVGANISNQRIRDLFQLLPLWLSRSGNTLLDIYVSNAFHRHQIDTIFALLAPFSPRIRALDIPIQESASFPSEFQCSSLESLILEFLPQRRVVTPPSVFVSATLLRHLTLSNATLSSVEYIPIELITHLEFRASSSSAYSCLEILRRASRLEELIAELEWDRDLLHPPALLTLAHLHTLRLVTSADRTLFPFLVLPKLDSLELNGLNSNAAILRGVSLGERSSWTIRSICLRHMNTDAILQMLSINPSLEIVHIDWPLGSLALLFVQMASNAPFIPALRQLSIQNYRPETSEIAVLASTLTSSSLKVSISLVHKSDVNWVKETLREPFGDILLRVT
ncbi:Beta-lactamase domain-containing protein [Mycena indigotica]|uniref:Beta-lactamase domain-containing protein n=1 Tax=Mycena indigotica TaxID=2126181 RepID=A0A8H6W2C6_9AGAR|nr:Beta-lactamase domain-containing protein [Mycena indigotica]KAF7299118.1 Beta-lactamase domain-containing protein [Mycena indigotica]